MPKSVKHRDMPEKEFKIPKWWECQWRRVPCGKDSCKMCGQINKTRKKQIAEGKDPDSMESAFEHMQTSFSEAFATIKKDAERMGIDITNIPNDIVMPPKPDYWPLSKKVTAWRNSIFDILNTADETGEPWAYTELADDLSWYANLLQAKTYRQLCTKWEQKHGMEYGDIDLKYTKYIIEESLKIIKKSMSEIMLMNPPSFANLLLVKSKIAEFEDKLMKI